jgi:hypothetical protein
MFPHVFSHVFPMSPVRKVNPHNGPLRIDFTLVGYMIMYPSSLGIKKGLYYYSPIGYLIHQSVGIKPSQPIPYISPFREFQFSRTFLIPSCHHEVSSNVWCTESQVIVKPPQAVFEVRRMFWIIQFFLNREFKESLCDEFLNFGCHTGLIELDDFGELILLFFQECVDLT